MAAATTAAGRRDVNTWAGESIALFVGALKANP